MPVAEMNGVVQAPRSHHTENPVQFRWGQLILRVLSVVYSWACLVALIYLYAKYQDPNSRLWLSTVSVGPHPERQLPVSIC